MSEESVPYSPRAHVRVSTSTSITTPMSSLVKEQSAPDADLDMALDTYALAREIGEFWNVDDPELVVIQFGGKDVAAAHRRMKYMSRRQKLTEVRSLENYFMSILIKRVRQARSQDADKAERSDDYYEEYLKRQKERGQ